MPDVQAWRAKLGVIAPSTNTIVQPDMELMRPPGVTNHYSRILTPNSKAVNDETAYAATLLIGENVMDAVNSVLTCEPRHLVMGMSAITFFGGAKGARAFQDNVQSAAGIGCSIGSLSCTAALKAYGGIKRIAFLSPYYPISNAQVRQYFTDEGFEVMGDIPLRATSWTGIAEITTSTLRQTITSLNGPDVDAIIQVGTNCSMVKFAAAAELWLNKPIIAINTATYWHALRTLGINDKIYGLGRLLEDF